MPIICRFYGIVIAMYFKDHSPPHLHAKYGGFEAQIRFDGSVLGGELPARALRFVQEWIQIHADELHEDWRRAQSGELLLGIAPLE
ncbi:MAG: DUF4160 domain-containing protein [Spongiibacteraceae bacterium]